MNNLINNIDHSKFDLEWAKCGGVAYGVTTVGNKALWSFFQNRFMFLASMPVGKNEWLRPIEGMMVGSKFNDTYTKIADRMATPQECAEAGVEYIEPPNAELEELRKDKARLDWLCKMHYAVAEKINGHAVYSVLGDEYLSIGSTPREAIDSAMRGEK